MDRTPVRKLEFVEVRSAPARVRRQRKAAGAGAGGGPAVGRDPVEDDGPDATEAPLALLSEPGWSLWGDAEN